MNIDKYLEFIESCRNKKYTNVHKHHIIPKHMGGTDEEENLIELGYEDHQKAHIILAECFDKGTPEHYKNICAAGKLNRWVKNPNMGKLMSEALKGLPKTEEHKEAMRGPRPHTSGENNHYYGKGQFGEDNAMFGKSVLDFWKEKYGEEEANRMWKEKNKGAAVKIAKSLKGIPKSVIHKQNLSTSKQKFWDNVSDEYREEWSHKMKERETSTYKRTPELNKQMSEILKKSRKEKPLSKEKCVYCGIETTKANIKRWHDDKCKKRH